MLVLLWLCLCCCLDPAAVLRVFAKESSLPSLVHCAHGKDRTGVVIMLLLLICDTPHEAIVQDYVQVGGQAGAVGVVAENAGPRT